MRTALVQLTSSDTPADNLPVTLRHLQDAADGGAGFVLTPEVTNCVSTSRAWQHDVLQTEAEDITLAGLRDAVAKTGIWLLIGSLALKTADPDGRFANRSFLISPSGEIVARYDKMHMFDVSVSETETYRESAGYRPGNTAIWADTPFARIGLTICYDLRFPQLYRHLAQQGASVLTVPSAFSPVTGAAHWDSLLRARAIENGAWILAPAQTGLHKATQGKARQTFGHGYAVAPWGDVIADCGTQPGVTFFDLDMALVDTARQKVPSLTHDRPFNQG